MAALIVSLAQTTKVLSQLVEFFNQLQLLLQGQSSPLAMEGLRPFEELVTGEELAVNFDFEVPNA